jgi:hypothetical protein
MQVSVTDNLGLARWDKALAQHGTMQHVAGSSVSCLSHHARRWLPTSHAQELPVPPRCVSLAQLGTMAAADDAVVIPLMRGWLGASGLIAQVLQDAGAQYSGGCVGGWCILAGVQPGCI